MKKNWLLYLGIVWFILSLVFDAPFLVVLGFIAGPFMVIVWCASTINAKVKSKKNEAAKVNTGQQEEASPRYDYVVFRVAGVTHNNDDGSSRQAILRKIKFRDPPFDTGSVSVFLEESSYNGEPSIIVTVNDMQIGFVPNNKVADILDNWDKIDRVTAFDVIGGGHRKGDGRSLSYGAEVIVRFFKSCPDESRPANAEDQHPDYIAHADAYKSYDEVGIYRPDDITTPMPDIGERIYFLHEYDNPYDVYAIRAIYRNKKDGVPIVCGYLNKGRLRDMMTDWIDRGDAYAAWVTRADSRLEVKIDFFR